MTGSCFSQIFKIVANREKQKHKIMTKSRRIEFLNFELGLILLLFLNIEICKPRSKREHQTYRQQRAYSQAAHVVSWDAATRRKWSTWASTSDSCRARRAVSSATWATTSHSRWAWLLVSLSYSAILPPNLLLISFLLPLTEFVHLKIKNKKIKTTLV